MHSSHKNSKSWVLESPRMQRGAENPMFPEGETSSGKGRTPVRTCLSLPWFNAYTEKHSTWGASWDQPSLFQKDGYGCAIYLAAPVKWAHQNSPPRVPWMDPKPTRQRTQEGKWGRIDSVCACEKRTGLSNFIKEKMRGQVRKKIIWKLVACQHRQVWNVR